MGHCIGLATNSDIGLLSGRDRDFELPEYRKAERMCSDLVSPVNI